MARSPLGPWTQPQDKSQVVNTTLNWGWETAGLKGHLCPWSANGVLALSLRLHGFLVSVTAGHSQAFPCRQVEGSLSLRQEQPPEEVSGRCPWPQWAVWSRGWEGVSRLSGAGWGAGWFPPRLGGS